MKKHSINIADHQTSISLEEEFWQELRAIADARKTSINKLVEDIDSTRAENQNLSSAIRVYILKTLKSPTAG